jgi:3-deoxy-7-phosphoheptulonate synthase
MPEVPGAQLHSADYVSDRRIERVVPLLAPDLVLDELPLNGEQADVVIRGRSEVQDVLRRTDERLLAVVGPCSVHDPDATLEYAAKLQRLARDLSGELLIAMRVYFEKPRTTIGWKGLINDPHLDGSGDVNTGLHLARQVLLGVLDTGLPVGCEFLDPITPQYIADAVSWGAIGARTTESQIHRQLGSGLSMPVGFKNRTDGNVQVAVDAVRAAAEPHAFAGIDRKGTPAILYTRGNTDCHIILRGGKGMPNYPALSVAAALELLDAAHLPRRLMIDLSHDNSGKDPERQPAVAADVGMQVKNGNRDIAGVMLESFLLAGRQDLKSDANPPELRYGQSITDGCIGWETTVEVLEGLAESVRDRSVSGVQTAQR